MQIPNIDKIKIRKLAHVSCMADCITLPPAKIHGTTFESRTKEKFRLRCNSGLASYTYGTLSFQEEKLIRLPPKEECGLVDKKNSIVSLSL